MFDRRLIQYFNWGFFLLILMLAAIGVLTIYSAVAGGSASPEQGLYIRQLIWYGAGFGIMMVTLFIDYRHLETWAYLIYIGCILLLVAVIFVGREAGGSQRWLRLGFISIQPSEPIKVAVAILLARCYAKTLSREGLNFYQLFKPMILVALPFLLIVKQPDLGTGMMVLLIAGSMTLFVKIEKKTLMAIILIGAAGAFLSWFTVLKSYQKRRILTFLDPDRDPLGAGYHIIQSKIAIGSGMISGKGIFQGTQNTLSFLPEQHTDFIFAVWAEEWGFIGSFFLVFLFMLLIIWGLNIAYACKEPFGTILAVGLTTIIFWQVIINISMVIGLMPVVGMPLPFISYGGSSVITVMICAGILLNISMRRFAAE